MSSYKSQPVSTRRPLKIKASPATQTMLSLLLGPKARLDLILQVQTPEMMRHEEERKGKIMQARKEEKERQRKAIMGN